MKAAVVRSAGQAPVYAEFADPVAEAGEALVTVTASAISQVTRSRASGQHYSSSGQFPFVAGIDGVGRTEDGRRVYFLMPRAPWGAMADRVAVRAAQCMPLPDDLDDVTAAAIANPGMSSWMALAERAQLKPGETVLVNGATGAAGRLAVQVAKHLGAARVIATGRNATALAEVAQLGADATIALTEDDDGLEQELKAEFAKGVDVVLDYLWGHSAEVTLIAAAKAAPDAVPLRYVEIGSSSGLEITLPSAALRSSAIQLMGSGLGSIAQERVKAAIPQMFAVATSAGFRIATRKVPLAEVESAWALEQGGARIVLTTDALGS